MVVARDVRTDGRERDQGRVLLLIVGGLAALGALHAGLATVGGAAPTPCPDARVEGVLVSCGESPQAADHGRQASGHVDARAWLFGEKLDLNRASALDIARVPGVGKNLARAIVAERERRGRFRSLAEVHVVRGVGPAKLRLLERYVVVPAEPNERQPAASGR